MKRFLALAVITAALAVPAAAADLKPLIVKAPPLSTGCTVTQCSGWYVGASIAGIGTTVDFIGQGINGALAGGGYMGGQAGYQLWNGKYFAAAEIGAMYETNSSNPTTPVLGSNRRDIEFVLIKGGMGLDGLLGLASTAPTSPSQAPTTVSVPASLASALLSPYVQIGSMWRGGKSQEVNGGGVGFVLSSHVDLDLSYLYAPAMDGLPAANFVFLKLNYKN